MESAQVSGKPQWTKDAPPKLMVGQSQDGSILAMTANHRQRKGTADSTLTRLFRLDESKNAWGVTSWASLHTFVPMFQHLQTLDGVKQRKELALLYLEQLENGGYEQEDDEMGIDEENHDHDGKGSAGLRGDGMEVDADQEHEASHEPENDLTMLGKKEQEGERAPSLGQDLTAKDQETEIQRLQRERDEQEGFAMLFRRTIVPTLQRQVEDLRSTITQKDELHANQQRLLRDRIARLLGRSGTVDDALIAELEETENKKNEYALTIINQRTSLERLREDVRNQQGVIQHKDAIIEELRRELEIARSERGALKGSTEGSGSAA